MAKRKLEFHDGDIFGWLTVIREVNKDATGRRQLLVRCRCGDEHIVTPGFLNNTEEPKCVECARKYRSEQIRLDIVGSIFNNWEVFRLVGKNRRSIDLCECRCVKCGQLSIKTKGEMGNSKHSYCKNCSPDFHFVIDGDSAKGLLPDGSEFWIDASDVDRVSKYYWFKNSHGYISNHKRGNNCMYLHRFILGYEEKTNVLIDHVNRNRLDCRNVNLRIVTPAQNSMNRNLQSNNKTGYVGRFFLSREQLYQGQIGINNRNIKLGTSTDSVVCAQMHNIAAIMLFGDYAGHVNDVPDPPLELVARVAQKVAPYITAERVTASYEAAFAYAA